ncbi:MAG: sensor histidine kinase [Ruminococcus sp.]
MDIFESTYYGNSFCLVTVALLEFVVIKVIGKFKNLNNDAPVSRIFFAIAILIPFISVLFETILIMQKNIGDIIYALSLLCVVSLNFLVIYLYDSISKLFNKNIETEIAKQETEYYHKQAELIQKNSQEAKQLRHDLKNYTIALSELIRNNENNKALEYMSSVSGILEPAKTYCNTGILSVDSIVNYKFTRAEEMGIFLDSEITIPYNLNLKSSDLVAILGNLLDNAIEASSKADKKYIRFRATYDKGTILIVVSNSYHGELKFEGNTYQTTKKDDTASHGIGLKSIKSIVEKYNGEIRVTHTDTEFSVRVLLFN